MCPGGWGLGSQGCRETVGCEVPDSVRGHKFRKDYCGPLHIRLIRLHTDILILGILEFHGPDYSDRLNHSSMLPMAEMWSNLTPLKHHLKIHGPFTLLLDRTLNLQGPPYELPKDKA